MIAHKYDRKTKRHTILLDCECQCGDGMRIVIDNDYNDCWACSTTTKFSAQQSTFLTKIRIAWKILTENEFWFHSLILSKDDMKELHHILYKCLYSCAKK